MNLVDNFRDYRSKKLEKIAKAVANMGIKANHITTLSLITGILGVYYLFNNYYLFALFALLHLIFDGLDGVIARVTIPTTGGKYFDLISDSVVTFLAIVKTGFYLQDFYAYIAAGLFLLTLTIHLASRMQIPMLFMRTATIIILLIATNSLFPFTKMLLTAGYLVAGGVSLYSLSRPLQWHVNKK